RPELRRQPVAVLEGELPLEKVFAINSCARRAGLVTGMSRLQAESFSGAYLLLRSQQQEEDARSVLLKCATEFSPRIESVPSQQTEQSGGTAVLDISGSDRLFGTPKEIAETLRNKIAVQGILAHVAASQNFFASVCAARGLSGVTAVPNGKEADILGPLPLDVLDLSSEA